MEKKNNFCVICGQKCVAYKYFGVQSCRACSAFFRRSVAEKKNYRCHFKNNCNVKYGNYYNSILTKLIFRFKDCLSSL